MAYQVFISFKNLDAYGRPTRDSVIAAELYRRLRALGIDVFFSNEEVQRKARPDYGDLIDEALDSSRILLLVGSSVDYIESRWIKYEWNSFKNEINSGRKNGYIIPVLEGITIGDLPFALRHGQVYTSDQLDSAVDMAAGVLGSSASSVNQANKTAYSSEGTMSASEMNTLATDYYYGSNGKPLDYTEAAKWFRKAAEQGNADGQTNLGVCYLHSRGVPQDYAEAAKWFRKAAEQGHADGQNSLGWCYVHGQGVPQDCAEAVKLYRKTAEQGNAGGQYNLGACYECGAGVPKDIVEALKWYRLAAEQGQEDAKKALARMTQ